MGNDLDSGLVVSARGSDSPWHEGELGVIENAGHKRKCKLTSSYAPLKWGFVSAENVSHNLTSGNLSAIPHKPKANLHFFFVRSH